MKIIVLLIAAILLLGLFFFVVEKTYTIDGVCGWEGLEIKDWPCRCLGKKSGDFQDSAETISVSYCTGFNLSCSDFMLEKLLCGGETQCPTSCQIEAEKGD